MQYVHCIYLYFVDCIKEESCLSRNGFMYEHDTCFCYKYLEKSLLHDEAVTECTSMNADIAKVNRAIMQVKIEQLLSMKITVISTFFYFVTVILIIVYISWHI